jgi:NTP pyrophosphatase (non-canonical NTP hydrolase)
MAIDTLSHLRARAKKVVRILGWEIYHTPENLTFFLIGEAAELGELCQWVTRDEIRTIPGLLDCVQEEIADVVKCVLYLTEAIRPPTHLENLILSKLKIDEKNFPVGLFKGKSKYEIINPKTKKESIPDIPKGGRLRRISTGQIQKRAWKLVTDRDWEKFYTPASLALAISKNCGEVATCYQRRIKPVKCLYQRTVWALADVLINIMRLCEYLEISDIHPLVLKKLEADEKRFAILREA